MPAARVAGQYVGRRSELHVDTANSPINLRRPGGHAEPMAGKHWERKMTCNLVCEIKIRRWITPVLVIACLTKWDWLLMKCISMKIKTVQTEA